MSCVFHSISCICYRSNLDENDDQWFAMISFNSKETSLQSRLPSHISDYMYDSNTQMIWNNVACAKNIGILWCDMLEYMFTAIMIWYLTWLLINRIFYGLIYFSCDIKIQYRFLMIVFLMDALKILFKFESKSKCEQ